MKIQPASADSFAAAPPPAIRAALVYGPDVGLVRERADALIKSVAGALDDPFRVAPLLSNIDGASLYDEAAAMAFGGGRRAIVIRDANESLSDALERFLDAPPRGDTLVVLSAGDLAPRSGLRRLCEERDNAAALALYEPCGFSLGPKPPGRTLFAGRALR